MISGNQIDISDEITSILNKFGLNPDETNYITITPLSALVITFECDEDGRVKSDKNGAIAEIENWFNVST